jgi:hypothetical protein
MPEGGWSRESCETDAALCDFRQEPAYALRLKLPSIRGELLQRQSHALMLDLPAQVVNAELLARDRAEPRGLGLRGSG